MTICIEKEVAKICQNPEVSRLCNSINRRLNDEGKSVHDLLFYSLSSFILSNVDEFKKYDSNLKLDLSMYNLEKIINGEFPFDVKEFKK